MGIDLKIRQSSCSWAVQPVQLAPVDEIHAWTKKEISEIVRNVFIENARFAQSTQPPRVSGQCWVSSWLVPPACENGDAPPGALLSMWLTLQWDRIRRCIETFLGLSQCHGVLVSNWTPTFPDARTALCSLARRHHTNVLWDLPRHCFRPPFSNSEGRLREVEDYLWHWIEYHDELHDDLGTALPWMRDFL